MTRTQRTPQQVMDDATWGVFQAGYRDGFGADADHLKNPDDIDACLACGFTFFTIDPGDHVDPSADTALPRPAPGQIQRPALGPNSKAPPPTAKPPTPTKPSASKPPPARSTSPSPPKTSSAPP